MSRAEPVSVRTAPRTSWLLLSTFFFEKPASGWKQTTRREPSRVVGRASLRNAPTIWFSLQTSSTTAGHSACTCSRSTSADVSASGSVATAAAGAAVAGTGPAARGGGGGEGGGRPGRRLPRRCRRRRVDGAAARCRQEPALELLDPEQQRL